MSATEATAQSQPTANASDTTKGSPEAVKYREDAYGTGDEGAAETLSAQGYITRINDALNVRERNTLISNGIQYSRAYLYNQQKAINYAPPRNPKDDREVSVGMVHEKIIAFVAVFLKYNFRRRIKVYGKDGKAIDNLGEVYDLAIEFSHRMEQFGKRLALIFWEVFTQGNAFVLEDWEVRTMTEQDAYDADGKKVDTASMDFTYDTIDKMSFKPGKEIQTRRAVSRLLDGRMVIFGNPEIEEVQDQPFIAVEEEISRTDAEQLYGALKRWAFVPKEAVQIDWITPMNVTLFNTQRLDHPENRVIVHRLFDKPNNRFNILLNGMMMLPRNTPMKLFYPRNNYPLTNIPAERLKGSIYCRSVPAKTKFNADFVDWALKNLALKFEQGVIPAILAKGKYTLSRQIFRAGQVTHGVASTDFTKADPDNKGVTVPDVNFFTMMKEIVEAQTLNPTATGEFDPNASATQIAITDQNQRDKLAFLLDGIAGGFMDMALRRAETIESKYTIKQSEKVVNGVKVNVYQNFTIDMSGVSSSVIFDDAIGDPTYNHEQTQNKLHQEAVKAKKNGKPSETYIANPDDLREGKYELDVEIVPERIKEIDLQMQSMWAEFTSLLNTFGRNVNIEELKSIYLEVRGRPASIFNSADVMKLQQITAQGQGAFGTPGATEGGGGAEQPGQGAPGAQPSPVAAIGNNKGRKAPSKMPALMQ